MEIRLVQEEDLLRYFDFIRSTFVDTYAEVNSKQNMMLYLTNNLSNQQLKKEVENPNCHFYIALENDTILGYLKLNQGEAQTETSDLDALEIERIYVNSNIQGKGIGKKLIDFCKEESKKRKSSFLWLGVWENNENALGFYKHMGFEIFDTHSFKLGNEDQRDYLMKWRNE